MDRKNNGSGIIAVAIMVAFFLFAGLIMDATTPKCIKSGCNREQAERSSYCYLHKPHSSSSSYKPKPSYSSNSSSSTSKSSGKKSSNSSDLYDSYDAGYEDICENEDYD